MQVEPMELDEEGRPENAMDIDPVPHLSKLVIQPSIQELNQKTEQQDQDAPIAEEADPNAATTAEVSSALSMVAKTPEESVSEIMSILRTAFPLLTLSLETMVEQMLSRLKPSPEEDMYRVISALNVDAYQHFLQTLPEVGHNGKIPVPPQIRSALEKLVASPFVQSTKVGHDIRTIF